MNSNNDGSFHRAISRVLLMGNFLGFPVCGIFSKNPSDLKFSWKSFRAVYSLYLLLMSLFFLVCYICWMISHGDLNLSKFARLTTFLRNVFCLICFIRLAKVWPGLMYKWSCVEETLPVLNDSKKKHFLKNRIAMVQVLVVAASLGRWKSTKVCKLFASVI